MITAVDANVLLDLFKTDAPHRAESREAMVAASDRGTVIACDVVYAELVPWFGERPALDEALRDVQAQLSPIDSDIAWEAGLRWGRYRRAGGPRKRLLADFLIGAHALARADIFLTRDQGFFSTYFGDLVMADTQT